jgi:membrane protein
VGYSRPETARRRGTRHMSDHTRQWANVVARMPDVRIGNKFSRNLLADLVEQIVEDDVMGLAAELAYRSTLTVLPFLLMLAALPSVLGSVVPLSDVQGRLSHEAEVLLSKNSAEMANAIIHEITTNGGGTAFLLGLVGTLWSGTSTTSALRKAINRMYAFEEESSFVKRKAIELLVTAVVGSLLFIAIALLLLGPAAFGGVRLDTQALSLILAIVFVILAVSITYWLIPAGGNTFRWVTPGSALFALGWLLFSFGLSAYLSQVGTLNGVYGSLGAIIMLMIWLYGSNLALLLGAELNAVLGKTFDEEVQQDSEGGSPTPP